MMVEMVEMVQVVMVVALSLVVMGDASSLSTQVKERLGRGVGSGPPGGSGSGGKGGSSCSPNAFDQPDQRWTTALGLGECMDGVAVTLLDVYNGDLAALEAVCKENFPKVTPVSAVERECLMHNPNYPYNSAMLQQCVPLIAPAADASPAERAMAVRGLMIDPDTSEKVSMCKPGMPCLEFNNFAANGTLEKSADECGISPALVKTLLTRNSLLTAKWGATLQYNPDYGLTDQCYGVFRDGTGMRGPVYGPIYWFNAKMIYFLEGAKGVARMPGCRIKCPRACEEGCKVLSNDF